MFKKFTAPIWSPVELEFLKANRDKLSENQLSLSLAKSRNAIKRKLAELDGKPIATKAGKRSYIGRREDLNMFTRSSWEADVIRYLKSKGHKVEYEPRVFFFEGIKKGTVSYCPDILVDGKVWIEVKGFLDAQSKTALRRFKKFYPDEFSRLKAVVGSANTNAAKFFQELGVPIYAYFNELKKECRDKIPHWESK